MHTSDPSETKDPAASSPFGAEPDKKERHPLGVVLSLLFRGGIIVVVLAVAIAIAAQHVGGDHPAVPRLEDPLEHVGPCGIATNAGEQHARLVDVRAPKPAANRLARTPAEGYAAAAAAIRDADLTAGAAKITVPSVVVCGAEDGATTPEVVSAFAASLPNARYVELPDVGHLPSIEAPDATVSTLKTLLEEVNHG